MSSNSRIKGLVSRAIEEYNKYRSPEVTAELVSLSDEEFEVRFMGYFCYTCGYYNYFDDFRLELEDLGLKTEIVEVREFAGGAVVKFKVGGGSEG